MSESSAAQRGDHVPPGGPRDEWMRRAGPFYPLVIAARSHSWLPIAPDLEPTDRDRERSLVWLPVVGLGVGGLLAFAGSILFAFQFAPLLVATLIVGLTVVVRGAPAELAIGRALGRALPSSVAEDSGEGAASLVTSLAPLLLILLRGSALVAIATPSWSAALVASFVVGAWATAAGHAYPSARAALLSREPEHDRKSLWHIAVATAGSVVVILLCGAVVGSVVIAVSIGLVALGRFLRWSPSTAGGIAEVVGLFCFAAAFPAV